MKTSFFAQKQTMTEGPLLKKIVWFSLPLMFSQLLQVLFTMADVAVVGKFAGSAALGAVGSTTTLVTLFTGLLIGLGCGVNVCVARYMGAKRARDVEEFVHTAAVIMVLGGGLLLGLCWVFAEQMLALLNTKPDLLAGAVLYMQIYALGMPALGIFNWGSAVLGAVGETKRPLVYLGLAGVLNVALNLFFVIVWHLDVAGVAWASIIAQWMSALLITVHLLRENDVWRLQIKKLGIYPGRSGAILRLGVPAGMQNAVFAVANLFVQSGVNAFSSTVVAGNAAAANADALVYNVMAAVYTAASSFISQNRGANRLDRVKKTYTICMGYSFLIGIVLGGALALWGEGFLRLFSDDAAVIVCGMDRLRVMGFAYALSALMDCPIASSRGIGKSIVPTVMVLIGSCVVRIVWVYTVFAYFHTIFALYLVYPFTWLITAAAQIVYFSRSFRALERASAAEQNNLSESESAAA